MRRLFLACFLILLGCSDPRAPGEAFTLSPAGDWTDAELAEIQASCEAWRAFSAGRVACSIGPNGDATLVRGEAGPTFARLRLVAAREIIIDPDGLSMAGYDIHRGLGALSRNMMGQALGIHLHDGAGTMSREDVRFEFTAADRISCRAAGYCE